MEIGPGRSPLSDAECIPEAPCRNFPPYIRLASVERINERNSILLRSWVNSLDYLSHCRFLRKIRRSWCYLLSSRKACLTGIKTWCKKSSQLVWVTVAMSVVGGETTCSGCFARGDVKRLRVEVGFGLILSSVEKQRWEKIDVLRCRCLKIG